MSDTNHICNHMAFTREKTVNEKDGSMNIRTICLECRQILSSVMQHFRFANLQDPTSWDIK